MMAVPARELAILGGQPAFAEPLHVGRPDCGDRTSFLARVNDILDSAWLSNGGPYVRRFEEFVAQTTGAAHCVAFTSATTALELLVQALGLQGEVIVPSFTFAATPHSLVRHGVTPVFADIDPDTFCLDPRAVEKLITPQTTAVLGVHCWGNSCAVEELTRICDHHRLKLLFDAAHAFHCSHAGRPIGTFGVAEVFSFHATKFLHSFEGGAVTTNDASLAHQLRLLRNFGLVEGDDAMMAGTNGKMTEIAAAMGLTMAESLDRLLAANHRNQKLYTEAFAGIEGLTVMPDIAGDQRNGQYVVVLVDEAQTGLHRDILQKVLMAENVLARRYFYPGCHRLTAYQEMYRLRPTDLQVTGRMTGQVLVLPTGTAVGEEQIQCIAEICRTSLRRRVEITASAACCFP